MITLVWGKKNPTKRQQPKPTTHQNPTSTWDTLGKKEGGKEAGIPAARHWKDQQHHSQKTQHQTV